MSQTTTLPVTGSGAERPTGRRRTTLVVAGLVLVLAVVALVWVLRGGDDKVPYSDAASTGTLTLCGADGKPVTSGSTTKAPFVERAVGATAATGALAGPGRAATLYAFQPRKGTDAQEWSGQILTAASDYTSTAHPMAQATDQDVPLRNFLTAFPPEWDGIVQLRLSLSSPQTGVGATYDSVSIKVDGSSWKVVGPTGTASCTAGSATSHETTAGSGR
jgi:hypothetical protein